MELAEICKRLVGNGRTRVPRNMHYDAGRRLADIAGIRRSYSDGYARASKLYELGDVLNLLVKNKVATSTDEAAEIARYLLGNYIGNTTLDKVIAVEGVFYYFDELTARFLRMLDEISCDE